jgi:hypothetical protein
MQDNWRWCQRCSGLFFGGSLGVCPQGGLIPGGHNYHSSGDYSLPQDFDGRPGQSPWFRCHKCQGLFFGRAERAGVCPAGDAHERGLHTYVVAHGSGPGQSGWRWCHKCEGMFFSGLAGLCPAGDHHDTTGSGAYFIEFLDNAGPIAAPHLLGWSEILGPGTTTLHMADDCDIVDASVITGRRGEANFVLRSEPPIGFTKALEAFSAHPRSVQTQDENRGPVQLTISEAEAANTSLILSKGKLFNALTRMYQFTTVRPVMGMTVTFTWRQDACGQLGPFRPDDPDPSGPEDHDHM